MILFRAGKSLLLGEPKNKAGSVWFLEATHELVDGSARTISKSTVKVDESFVVNPDYKLENESKTTNPRHYTEIIHENVLPLIATGRETEIGERKVIAYERHSRGLAFCESDGSVAWSSLSESLQDVHLGETLALEAVRDRLVERGIVNPTYRGRVSDSYKVVAERFHVYMKVNPFRDITLIREGTEVRPAGYYQGCIVLEADGEEFWLPIEEANLFGEEFKNDLWYFNMDGDNDGLPDPLTALPSKVALRSEPSQYIPKTMNWDKKADLRTIAGHLLPDAEIDQSAYTVMGEGFNDLFLQWYWRHGEPEMYDISAKPGGTDKARHEPEINKSRAARNRLNREELKGTGPGEVPKDWKHKDKDDNPSIDDGTHREAVEALAKQLVAGTSVEAVFEAPLEIEKQIEASIEELRKIFPGAQHLVSPALRSTNVGP